jgi:hypothetical protein
MRIIHAAGALSLLTLAACMGSGPDVGTSLNAGVGFGDYHRYLREREAAAAQAAPLARHPRGSVFSNPPVPLASTLPARPMPAPDPGPVRQAAAPQPVAPAPQFRPAGPIQPGTPLAAPMQAPMQTAQMGTLAPAAPGFGTTPAFDAGPSGRRGISDEQDFDAVASRETIESDRERLARQRAQYQVVQVDSVPTGVAASGPNIVAYALSQTHPVGTRVYSRAHPLRWQRWEQACLQYRNQDLAQEAFLAAGGPDRDPNHLDPDGDGYACWWDPAPFRQIARAGQ